jgi:hypothetical protein
LALFQIAFIAYVLLDRDNDRLRQHLILILYDPQNTIISPGSAGITNCTNPQNMTDVERKKTILQLLSFFVQVGDVLMSGLP